MTIVYFSITPHNICQAYFELKRVNNSNVNRYAVTIHPNPDFFMPVFWKCFLWTTQRLSSGKLQTQTHCGDDHK